MAQSPAKKSFIASFWDIINNMSPRKKHPQPEPRPSSPMYTVKTSPPRPPAQANMNTFSQSLDARHKGMLSSKSSALGLSSRSPRSSPLPKAPRLLGQTTPFPSRQRTPRAATAKATASSQFLPDPYNPASILVEGDAAEQRQGGHAANENKKEQEPGREQETHVGGDDALDQDASTPAARSKSRTVGTPQSGKKTPRSGRSGKKRQQSAKKTPRSVTKATTPAGQQSQPTYYEIERILDFRHLAGPGHEDWVELLVHWSGYDDPEDQTWEDEDELQLTARDAVLAFWESHPAGGRDAALGIEASQTDDEHGICYRALQVVGGPKAYRKKKRSQSAVAELFRVEWVGYAEKTWEPRENLPEDMVQAYLDQKKAQQSKKRKRTTEEDD